jgi:Spy/CpxP family protein refolding chaperone
MFSRLRKVIAAVAACIVITGIAAYAQNQAPKPQRAGAAAKPAVRQDAQKAGPQALEAERLRNRARVQLGSLQGMLMPPRPEMIQKLAERLGLTDQQKEQIKQLYTVFENTVKPIRQQKIEALKAFMTAFRNPNVTKAELENLSEPILQADRAILDAEFDFWLAFRPILNPQQQAQLQSFIMRQTGQDAGNKPRVKGTPAVPAK